MLSAGLASSNLSWDFSLARRATSLSSLNWSANWRLRRRDVFTILTSGCNQALKWTWGHRGHVLIEPFLPQQRAHARAGLPAAVAVPWRNPAHTRCWPCCLPTGQTSGRFWWRSCWGWWCCWWWPEHHRGDEKAPIQNPPGARFEKHPRQSTTGHHCLLLPLTSNQTITFVPPTLMIR